MTVRGIDPALRSALDAEAAKLGISLNALILQLLRGSLGLDSTISLAHDLDSLAGSWSREEAEEFVGAIQGFEQVDLSLWHDSPGVS